MHPQIRNPTKTWRDHRPHHRSSPLQQTEPNQSGNSGRFAWTLLASVVQSRLPKHKAYKFHTWFKLSFMLHWRNIAKYVGLENAILNIVVGESKPTQTGLHGPPPYLGKRKCKFVLNGIVSVFQVNDYMWSWQEIGPTGVFPLHFCPPRTLYSLEPDCISRKALRLKMAWATTIVALNR